VNNAILVFMIADCCPHSQCLCLSTDSHRSFALDKRQFGNLEVLAFLQPAGVIGRLCPLSGAKKQNIVKYMTPL